jgi:cell division septum initiation protein DivIVA
MSAEPDIDRGRPTLSGDLPTVLAAAPMFRRALVGYDRFQVDTYVRWAEDELATAEREHEHQAARQLRTHADLEEARELLSHSPGGADFLQLSRRMGTMLAAATDEAEAIRADAEARAGRIGADAERVLADAGAEAARLVAEAVARAEETTAEAGRVADAAERTRREARAEAAAQRKNARAVARRAEQHAEQVRQRAVADAVAARLQARDDVVRLLSTGRDERRRADEAAAATRQRLDADAAAHRARLLAEVAELEQRRAVLSAEPARMADAPPVTDPMRRRVRVPLGRLRAHSGRV